MPVNLLSSGMANLGGSCTAGSLIIPPIEIR